MRCLRAGDEVLRVLVRDDGVGGADFAGGSGLVGLQDRVEALGGRITLHSDPAGWERPALITTALVGSWWMVVP
jgi:signal transduction histidine kinase